MIPAVITGKPLPSRYPPRFRRYIALVSGDVWRQPHRAVPAILGLGSGEAVDGRLLLIQALVLRLSTERKRLPGSAEGIIALRPDRIFGSVSPAVPPVSPGTGRPTGGDASSRSRGTPGRGGGVTVGIVDSGVYPHPDLTVPVNRIAAFYDLVLGRVRPYDDCGHGTHLAGVIAGSGHLNSRWIGVAPEARIAAVKVLDRWGRGLESKVIAGIEWCVRWSEALGLKVLNLSFGAPAQTPPETDPCCLAVEAAWRHGIVVVAGVGVVSAGATGVGEAAAGEAGQGTAGQGAAGESAAGAAWFRPTSPGNCPRIIAVAPGETAHGTGESGPDGVRADVFAPGVDVVSLLAPHSHLDPAIREGDASGRQDGYLAMSGSSVAAAVVSGRCAALLGEDRSMSPNVVKSRIAAAGWAP